MPNKPLPPISRFPFRARIGLALMSVSAIAFLVVKYGNGNLVMFAAGAGVVLVLLWGARFLPRLMQTIVRNAKGRAPRPGPGPSRASHSNQAQPDVGAMLAGIAVRNAGSELDRKLIDLRDHPNTPEHERRLADRQLKKRRDKRRNRKGA